MKLSATLVLVLLASGAVSLWGQQPAAPAPVPQDPPPVTFRVEVNYVEIDAVITDAQGNLVTDLTDKDFEVLEDGRPQMVSAFSLVNIPIERAVRPLFAAAPIEPDVTTNSGTEGRMYLIVLDSLHTSPLNALKVKVLAKKFIQENMAANDIAAVVFTQGTSAASQDFTSNKRLLVQAVDRLIGQKSPGRTATLIDQVNSRIGRLPGDPVNDPIEFERAYNARQSMERVRTLSEFMAGVRGRRKAMLLFGEGIEYDYTNILASSPASGVLETVRDAIGTATRANVAIYAIDPRGLQNPEQDLVFANNSPGADDPSLGDLGTRSAQRDFALSIDSLRQLAADTGGMAVVNQNELATAFSRIVNDNSTYYVLGYYSTNERRDGRFRNVTVRVKRPGLQVRARKGYLAPRGRAPESTTRPGVTPLLAAALDAMASPISVRDIPMRVFAAPIKGEAPNAVVAVSLEMDVNGFNFTEVNGTFTDRVEVTLTAVDALGNQKASTSHAVNMAMKPDTLQRARATGVRVLTQLEVPPGRYQFRVAAAEAGGRAASVIADVEVPDFYKPALAMSGLSLTSTSALDGVTVSPKDPLATLLPGPLSATREFAATDTIALFAEFYENLPASTPPHKVDVTTTIRADDGRVLSQVEEEMDSGELTRGRGGFGFTTRIQLNSLEPGLYVIHVEGHSRATKPEEGIGRDIQIRIR
ncbi:MAG: VWA domain-containing protein [Vicinamibacterales bacterium]